MSSALAKHAYNNLGAQIVARFLIESESNDSITITLSLPLVSWTIICTNIKFYISFDNGIRDNGPLFPCWRRLPAVVRSYSYIAHDQKRKCIVTTYRP